MKSGSIRRSEESAIVPAAAMRSKRSTGGLPLPTVPLPGGSCGFGGRVSEPCGYNNYSQTQLQQHRHENHHHHQNHHPRQHQCQMDNGQQKYVDDDDNDNDEYVHDDNDESFACSGDTVDNKQNTNNNHISPGNSSYEQHLCSGSSSVVSDSYGSYATSSQTIALFGASGITGEHFLQTALDAGYGVRCLPVDDPRRQVGGGGGKGRSCVAANGTAAAVAGWKTIKAALEDTKQVKRVLKSADFVVVMLNDLLPGKNKEYPKSFLSDFAARLYPLMRRQASIQVFLYQATSLASDVRGQTPMLSKVLKVVAQRRNFFLRDQDDVVRKIASEHMLRSRQQHNKNEDGSTTTTPHFAFVVTRPTVLLQDGPSSKKLSASKSQPGPFPVAHVDLAEFSLNALTAERLYNTSPYIVADSF